MTMTSVVPSPSTTRLRPVDAQGVRVDGGFWGDRLAVNRSVTIPHGRRQLDASGALGNFRNAARGSGRYVGGIDDAGLTFPFLDSDVYKWLEAVGWELGRGGDAGLASDAAEVVALVASAQKDDGYLNTFVQLSGHDRYSDLQWGHELYCVGHLLQAAVAWQRALGDETLLAVAQRAVANIEAEMGEGRREAIDGHPEIEMALVEAYRSTGREPYLALARTLVERRGRGLLGVGRLGSRYWQDHESPRSATSPAGHVVRQLYLDCGVVDVAVETGDRELLEAAIRRWDVMWSRHTYLTGALGSRHRDEAFGDPYELPPDRAYAETCAAIGSVMLAWRMLLATGDERFADALERTLYNAVLPGLSLDGASFFYTNPLRLRADPVTSGVAPGSRQPWYPCACCPPNLMRTISTFEHRIATVDETGIQLHQFAASTVEADVAGAPVRLRVETDQPWQGRVVVAVESAPAQPWALRIRVPDWAHTLEARVAGVPVEVVRSSRALIAERAWAPGDQVELDLAMPVRLTLPHPAIDAVRGCAALERGPLVYCVEEADLEAGASLDEVAIELEGSPRLAAANGLPDQVQAVSLEASVRRPDEVLASWPYVSSNQTRVGTDQHTTITAIPYFAWANRGPGPMRVWLPIADSPKESQQP